MKKNNFLKLALTGAAIAVFAAAAWAAAKDGYEIKTPGSAALVKWNANAS